ncbi:MAG: Do family serine endopeptidase [Thermodesulfobacteriota bacterium]
MNFSLGYLWDSHGKYGVAHGADAPGGMRGKRRPLGRLGVLGAALGLSLAIGIAHGSELRRSAVVKAVERATPAVVNVSTEQELHRRPGIFPGFRGDSFFEEFFRDFLTPFPRGPARTSLGSGVVVDPKGLILTNEHVIQGASSIRVTLSDQREFEAKVVGADPPSDLAVLRIQTKESLPVIPMGRSNDLMIGETVIAIGNPFGLSHTVTTGVISALNRSIRTESRVYRDFIQTDAAINPGNSGGPLLNIDGELIGINTAIYQKAQGVGFAIPIDRAKRIMRELIEHGEVHPAWIGLEVQSLDQALARSLGLEGRHGVLVTQVNPGGPAEKAGLRKGDLITSVGQTPITSRQDFWEALSSYTGGSQITIGIVREGREQKVRVQAGSMGPKEAARLAEGLLGLTVGPVSPAQRKGPRRASAPGVVVKAVDPQGLARRVGIQEGDLIRQVNDTEIRSLEDYEAAMTRALRRDNVTLLVQRGSYGYYVTLELGGGG